MSDKQIAIIGGGISGAGIAYFLSQKTDRPITVFERQSLTSETTYKSAGFIGFYGWETPTEVSMKRYGIRFYNDLLKTPLAQTKFQKETRLRLATSPEGVKSLKETASKLNDEQTTPKDAMAEYFSRDELEEGMILPDLNFDEIDGALFRPNTGYVSPSELAHEFIQRAKENGVTFEVNTNVEDITTDNGKVTGIVTESGPVKASDVVCAAGPWNLKLAESVDIDLPIKHTLGPVLLLESSQLKNKLPSFRHHESGYYWRQEWDGTIFVSHHPGDYDTAGTEYDPDLVSDTVPKDTLDEFITTLSTLVPSLIDAKIVEQWVGVRSLTPDRNPIVGWTDTEGLYVANYHASGIQLTPAAAEIISEQLLHDNPTKYYDEVSISRFDGHSDWRETEPPK